MRVWGKGKLIIEKWWKIKINRFTDILIKRQSSIMILSLRTEGLKYAYRKEGLNEHFYIQN